MKKIFSTQDSDHWRLDENFYALRGTYNPLQFVLSLDSDLNATLDKIGSGTFQRKDISPKAASAFSTLLHETIHWWQHIGSTSGFMLSFASLVQFHANLRHLKDAVSFFGPKKSLTSFLIRNYDFIPEAPRGNLNVIVNNWHDVEFNTRLIVDPYDANQFIKNNFFENVGHSLHISLSHTVESLAFSFDKQREFLPNPESWIEGFKDLKVRKVDNYYHGGPIRLAGIGARRIFEAQARFSQLQYLSLCSSQDLYWNDFKKMGMFGEVYSYAFSAYLKMTGFSQPESVVCPIVHLFLLVCDIAINPNVGYPDNISRFETFIEEVDPSYRFIKCCQYISKHPDLGSAIKNCSFEDYYKVSKSICDALHFKTPLDNSNKISSWATKHEDVIKLMKEDSTFCFVSENLPVRVCFSRHVQFMKDKNAAPEFFCWPGIHMVGDNLDRSMKLWLENQALFFSELGGEVRPLLLPNREESKIKDAFEKFFHGNILYDMVRQWTVSDGPFKYDYDWLTKKFKPSIVKSYADSVFEKVFRIHPDKFTSFDR